MRRQVPHHHFHKSVFRDGVTLVEHQVGIHVGDNNNICGCCQTLQHWYTVSKQPPNIIDWITLILLCRNGGVKGGLFREGEKLINGREHSVPGYNADIKVKERHFTGASVWRLLEWRGCLDMLHAYL